jgi:serine/threonine-protein kinase
MRVYGAGDEDGVPYLVLEYIDGTSLDKYLLNGQPMPAAIVAQVMDQISQALDYAHSRGVLHRDIKPSNILLTRDGRRAVLSDFGLALVLGQARLTMPGIILGTPRYMAPEQVRGANVDARTDIYALGVTCYEMLTGQPAFSGRGAELAIQIVNGQYKPPSQVNPALPSAVDNVFRSAMQIAPGRRYQTATQFSRALRVGLGLGTPPPGPPSRSTARAPGSRTNTSRIILILVCLIIIVAAVAALVVLTRGA